MRPRREKRIVLASTILVAAKAMANGKRTSARTHRRPMQLTSSPCRCICTTFSAIRPTRSPARHTLRKWDHRGLVGAAVQVLHEERVADAGHDAKAPVESNWGGRGGRQGAVAEARRQGHEEARELWQSGGDWSVLPRVLNGHSASKNLMADDKFFKNA